MPIAEVSTDGTTATITETLWKDIQEDYQTQINNKLNKSDFAIVNGSLTLDSGRANGSVNYPSGFTKNNCFVLSFMANNSANSNYGYGYIATAAGYTSGAIGHRVVLTDDNILVGINNPTDGSHDSGTATFNFKILLIKIN